MHRYNKGFTLIELMIVVAIIGILSVIAIPNFMNYQCKAKQSEAKRNLNALLTLEKAYFGEHDTYSGDLAAIGFTVIGDERYVYGVGAGQDWFTAAATAVNLNNNTDDVWTINELGILTNVTPACR